MRRQPRLYLLALSFVLAVSANTSAGEPTFTTIDVPGAISTDAIDINSAGDIVGRYVSASGKTHGFLLSGSVFTSIDFPDAVLTMAFGINSSGDIVGTYRTADGHSHGFLLGGGVFSSIDFSATFTRAQGINARGDIVGRYDDASGRRHGFLLSEGGEFTSIDFPGDVDTAAWGITPARKITGRYQSADGRSHGFLLSGGEFITIDFPGAVETAPEPGPLVRINPRGDIVGSYCDAGGAVPCSRTAGHVRGFQLSNEGEFTSFDFPDGIGTTGNGINPRGDIVGGYIDQSGRTHGFLFSKGEFNEDSDDDEPRFKD
jgi:probable HAF family extracellular repeat protein